MRLCKVTITYEGDEVCNESSLIICNHNAVLDALVTWDVGLRAGTIGAVRYVAKKEVLDIPVFNSVFKETGTIFLERVPGGNDEMTIHSSVKEILSDPREQCIVLFPEGHRFTHERHTEACAIAQRKKLPEPRHVLLPRIGAYKAIFEGVKEKLEALYVVTIAYPQGVPSWWRALSGKGCLIHYRVQRIPVREIPDDYDHHQAHLYALFSEMDEWITKTCET
jgi:1-acyl-sn-glycerol-3-phosphate acyltransferase